jgi:hypothetical protein
LRPIVRQPVYDTYWRFAAARQEIFHKRAEGLAGPWTTDPILQRYKFCNAYRASDRASQYLIRHVIHGEHAADLEADDVFLRVVLFRLFSKESTWEALEAASGGVRRATLNPEALGDLLERMRAQQPIYTAAFILAPTDVYGYRSKHRNHLELVRRMFRPGALGRDLARARTLEQVFEALRTWPMIGDFMGYQLAVDLNYTHFLDFSEDSFTVPGPGALRGLHKVFQDFGDRTPQQLIMDMSRRQDDEFGRLGLGWRDLFGRPLHAIDCQNLFCEVDKYSRVAFPEIASGRTRIKQMFAPSTVPLRLFYPPKWQINDVVSLLAA